METIKRNNSYNAVNVILKMVVLAIFAFATVSCSKNEDVPVTAISAKAQTFTVNGINDCNTSSGSGSTLAFDIPYTSSSSSKINQLQIKTTVSDGGSDNKINTKFTDENNTISWATCFRFGSQDWVEFEVVLEAQDGTMSNPSKVRVNKPSGAN